MNSGDQTKFRPACYASLTPSGAVRCGRNELRAVRRSARHSMPPPSRAAKICSATFRPLRGVLLCCRTLSPQTHPTRMSPHAEVYEIAGQWAPTFVPHPRPVWRSKFRLRSHPCVVSASGVDQQTDRSQPHTVTHLLGVGQVQDGCCRQGRVLRNEHPETRPRSTQFADDQLRTLPRGTIQMLRPRTEKHAEQST